MILSFFLCSCLSSDRSTNYNSLKNDKSIYQITSNTPHLHFSINEEWYLIITYTNKTYRHYIFCQDTSKAKIVYTPNLKEYEKLILNKAFDKKQYNLNFINIDSSYSNNYDYVNGNSTYFYFQDKNNIRYGEAKLTVFIKPNPIDENLYNYLIKQLLKAVEKRKC